MGRVENILKKEGPMLSAALARILQKEYAISNEAARQAISRAKTPVRKMKVFLFNKNQVFCYLEEQYNSKLYRERLYEALKTDSAVASVIVRAFENNYFVMKKTLLPIYSKSPIENTKGHRRFESIIASLIKQGVVCEVNDDYYAVSPLYSRQNYNIAFARSAEQIVGIVANDFVSWASKLNIVAFNSHRVFPETAIFAHFGWFATIPSYVAPLFDNRKKRPGFVLVDVLLKTNSTISDVSFFVEKVNIIRNFKNLSSFAPVLLVNGVNSEALKYLKANKVLVGVLSNLFDKKYTDILMSMYDVLRNATAVITQNPERLDYLIQEIEKNEGRFNNAMGDLFECMVGLFFNRVGCKDFEMNKQVPNGQGKYYEMDVLIERDNRILVVECKACRSRIEEKYVREWLSTRVPAFRKYIESTYPGEKMEFALWALGGFDEAAEKLLKDHKERTKKYDVLYLDKKGIYAYAKELNDRVFCEQINKHFGEYGEK